MLSLYKKFQEQIKGKYRCLKSAKILMGNAI